VEWTLHSGQEQPLVTSEQWLLLFDPDGQGWFHRDLLFVSVLQSLATLRWQPKGAGADDLAAREARDDTIFDDGEGQ
jgi:hypothetical protein